MDSLTESDKQELFALLRALIQIKSVNPPGDEQPAAMFVSNYLSRLGLTCRLVPCGRQRASLVAVVGHPCEFNPSIGFSGHLDVVPVSPSEALQWQYDPFSATEDNERIWGRGATDMKGGIASIITALSIRVRQNRSISRPIVLAFSCDEEDRMTGVRSLVQQPEVQHCNMMIVAEPTELKLARASRGRTWSTITVHGKTAHGSQAIVENNAILQTHYLIDELLKEDFSNTHDPNYGITFWQPISIQSGVEPGIVPDKLTMNLDCRVVPGDSCEVVWKRLERIFDHLHNIHPQFHASFEIVDQRPPWQLPAQSPIVKHIMETIRRTWPTRSYEEIFFAGSSDANIWMQHKIPSLIIGPGQLALAHSANEYVEKQQLIDATLLYLALMQ